MTWALAGAFTSDGNVPLKSSRSDVCLNRFFSVMDVQDMNDVKTDFSNLPTLSRFAGAQM